jgi:tetratricopeptide (TPR) repeat protein
VAESDDQHDGPCVKTDHTNAPTYRAIALLVAAIVLVSAHAAPRTAYGNDAQQKRAMAALEIAKQYYGEKDFKEAARLFHKAFSLDPKPAFLYNAARSEQRGFMLKEAQRDFQRILDLKDIDPETRKRSMVHLEEVRELGAHMKEETSSPSKGSEAAAKPPLGAAKPEPTSTKPQDPATAAQTAVANTPTGQSSILAWSTVGLGGVSLAIGTVMALGGYSAANEISDELFDIDAGKSPKISPAAWDKRIAEKSDHESKMTTGTVLAGVGVIAAGVGTYLLIKAPAAPSVTLNVGDLGPPQVVLSWRF